MRYGIIAVFSILIAIDVGTFARGAIASDSCVADLGQILAQKHQSKLEKKRNRTEQRLAQKEKSERIKRERSARENANIEGRITKMLDRSLNREPLLPSEVREMKAAARDLRIQGRVDDAKKLESRIARHEAKYHPPNRLRKLSSDEKQQLSEKVEISTYAVKQVGTLNTDVREVFENKILPLIAEDPKNAGLNYRGANNKSKIDGIPVGAFKKVRFSLKAEYRVIYHIDESGKAIIDAVGPRESVYSGKFSILD